MDLNSVNGVDFILVLLDLSAASDAVCHNVPLKIQKNWVGFFATDLFSFEFCSKPQIFLCL